MPTNITDTSTFTDPIQGPADDDPQLADSYNLGFQGVANRTRYLADRLGGADGSGEWSYPTPRARHIPISLADGREIRDTSGGTPEWRFATSPSVAIVWFSLVDSGRILFPLGAMLRDGMVITDVQVIVAPGAARSGTNGVRVGLYYVAPSFATPASNPITPAIVGGAYKYDDGTANKQLITLASVLGAGHTVVLNDATSHRDYFLEVRAGNTGAVNADSLYGVVLFANEPGPR